MAATTWCRSCPDALALGLLALLTLAGCSRSSDSKLAAPADTPAVVAERALEPPLAVSQAVPRLLTELPPMPRRETPLDRVANKVDEPADIDVHQADRPSEPASPDMGQESRHEPADPVRASAETRVAQADASSLRRDEAPPAAMNPTAAPPAHPAASPPSGAPMNPLPPLDDKPPAAQLSAGAKTAPFDPVKVNGPIFDNWPKPRVALLITGMEQGYIEPCGCAGLERMKGGMTRRYSLFKDLREKGWPVVGLDVGGIAHGTGQQAEAKFRIMVDGKRKMGYDAIAFGVDDLRLPAGELLAAAAGIKGQPSLFISANVGLFGFDPDRIATMRIVDVAGVKIGVTAILGKKYQQEVRNSDLEMLDPEIALQKIVPVLKEKASYLVLLAHATRQESIALGKEFPQFNTVVTSDGFPEPPDRPKLIEGTKTLLVEVGHKGMYAIVLGLYNDPISICRYQRVPLDSRFASAPEMKLLMSVYQDEVKAIGFPGAGPHPLKDSNGSFVGSNHCVSCHEISSDIWKKSGHGHAYETLVKLDPPRNFDPECVSCHVTGWHPTKFFPYTTGFESLAKTPHLANTGCEECHGPGEKHVAAENSGSEAARQTFRKAMVITKAEAEKQQCTTCHDGDNSPDFDFKTYWPRIEHNEKDAP